MPFTTKIFYETHPVSDNCTVVWLECIAGEHTTGLYEISGERTGGVVVTLGLYMFTPRSKLVKIGPWVIPWFVCNEPAPILIHFTAIDPSTGTPLKDVAIRSVRGEIKRMF